MCSHTDLQTHVSRALDNSVILTFDLRFDACHGPAMEHIYIYVYRLKPKLKLFFVLYSANSHTVKQTDRHTKSQTRLVTGRTHISV